MPDWIWVAVCLACVIGMCWLDYRHGRANRGNWQAWDQERKAREQTRPLGNAGRYFG